MAPKSRSAAKVERLASRQHGVVTRSQLLDLGLGPEAIKARLGDYLLPVHRGVYRVGHRAPSVEASYMAAVLACGESAVLSGRAAGHLLRLVRGGPPAPEVTAVRSRRVPGVRTRRARALPRSETARWRGIPVTSVPRTLVDLAGALDAEELGRACHEADVLHRVGPEAVERVLARRRNARGAARLRAILTGAQPLALSRLEALFVAAVREAGLPLPETNRRAGSGRVDCRWPDRRVTVELDSYRFHRSRHAWEADRRREREARARGDAHRRYTWHDVTAEAAAMIADLGGLLGPR